MNWVFILYKSLCVRIFTLIYLKMLLVLLEHLSGQKAEIFTSRFICFLDNEIFFMMIWNMFLSDLLLLEQFRTNLISLHYNCTLIFISFYFLQFWPQLMLKPSPSDTLLYASSTTLWLQTPPDLGCHLLKTPGFSTVSWKQNVKYYWTL